jgi:hypothetical protein
MWSMHTNTWVWRSCDRAAWYDVHVTMQRDKFCVIKPTRRTNFSVLFWNGTLHVSDSSPVHHQDFFTVHTVMVYVIQVCGQLVSRIRMELSSILILLASCPQTGMTYTIAVCTVKYSWWWTGELSETCRVSFQNKIEKLVHLVGFITQKLIYKHMSTSCVIQKDLVL